mgnify:CR=1 FL=1
MNLKKNALSLPALPPTPSHLRYGILKYYNASKFWRNMLALKLQGEARQAEGSCSSWQEAKQLANLLARLEREGLRVE